MDFATLEKLIRKKLPDYQKIYDDLPVFLQNILVTSRGYLLSKLRYNKIFWEMLDEIMMHDHFTEAELINYQNDKLHELIRYAYTNTEYYRKIMDERNLSPRDIQTIDDLKKLPVLRREDIKKNFDELLLHNAKNNGRIIVYTSGTSGSGLPIAYNKTDLTKNWAFMFRQFIWAGVKPKEWRITMFGSKIVPEKQNCPPYWRYNYFEKQILLSIYHLSETTTKEYLKFFEKHKEIVLEGFASVLAIVADFLVQEGISIPMKMVYSTGEPISAINRFKVEQAFECKLFDCYGMTEWVGLIQECEKGAKHLMSDYGILEILDENNRPVKAGEEGYLIWTGLQKEEMPLIRYKIGDRGMWHLKNECECGRPYPLVDATITRDSDIITSPEGTLFSPRVINQYLKNKVSFQSCQFIQDSPDNVVVRIVPGKGNFKKETQNLVNDLNKLFKESLKLTIHYTNSPLMRGLGKFPLIINQISNQ
ncbi:MAG: phenylacetate--CoA ligase family protein [Candidatus Hodarchaeota archaeon]